MNAILSFQRARLAHLAWFASLVLTVSGSIGAASGRNCLTVAVPGPLELPDGTVHPAASLTLCMSRAFSPVARLHEVALDGITVGLLLSRLGVSEAPGSGEPMVTFRRDREGLLHLIGYAWPSGSRSQTYLLQIPVRRKAAAASDETVLKGGSEPAGEAATLLAVRAP